MGAGLMSEEQRMQLQVQLSLIDQAIQQSQFEQRLSLDAETQAAYFDAVRRGLFRAD